MYFLGSTTVTIRKAFDTRHSTADGKKERYKLFIIEFNTVSKLSVIMGIRILKDSSSQIIGHNITGVFWIGEFISTAIGIEWCDEMGCSAYVCYSQLVLDIPNLLAVLKF